MQSTPSNDEFKESPSDMKYVVITGGVVSGLGKGITASSIGLLLKEAGLRVTAIKIDPYLNIDAGIDLTHNSLIQSKQKLSKRNHVTIRTWRSIRPR